VHTWLSTYIAPHQLVSISLFEKDHPNKTKEMNAIIVHTSGAVDVKLPEDAVKNLYKLTVKEFAKKEEWSACYSVIADEINRIGADQGHTCASTNNSSSDGKFIVCFSWD
jgi:hypothetical protein